MKPAVVVAVLGALLFAGCNRGKKETVATPIVNSGKAQPRAVGAAAAWKTVEEFDYALKPGQAPAHFTLQLPEKYNHPWDFTRIRIQTPGLAEFVLENEDGWVAYNNQEEPSAVYADLGAKNLVKSEYVLVLADSRVAGEPPLVFLRSRSYASNPERLHVIGFKPSGEPVTLINRELSLEAFVDLDGDGRPEIIGLPCLSQEFGHDLLTYDPYHVYKISQPITGPIAISTELSKAYNVRHHYGWAGAECSEKLAVVLHPPSGGKPVIMDVAEAEKLMQSSAK